MGNCCLRRGGDSVAVWAEDEEWICVSQLHQQTDEQPKKQKLLWEDHHQFRSSSTSSCRRRRGGGGDHQVKITITKRELEEFVGSKRGGGGGDVASVEQLLARAINVDCDDDMAEEENQVPWRPALQRIPEIN